FNLYKFRYLKWKYCVKDSYGIKPEEDEALKLEKELITKQNARKGPLYKIKNDPRKTKIGTFIEKYSIDELPQLFNVLIGNMSLVGPRPHQPREVEQYKEHQKRVLTIKPGITGMAQINGREKNDFDKEVQLDIFYIENWSILLDLKIFFKTIGTVLKRAMRS
ncbi:MAG: sugar transferase, partial [Candidatus Gracilibacteria bacterium]|nr:sugar transferase [Candidatus Gracilibacteria bacterium]